MSQPYLFDEFFSSGKLDAVSPFLTQLSRRWARHLPLRSALVSAFFFLLALCFHFINPAASTFFLAFVYFLVGTPALINALEDLRNLEINIDVLMMVAALLSIVIGSALEGGLLLVLFEISANMEAAVLQKTRSAVLNLQKMSPKSAWVIDEQGLLFQKAVQDIAIGTSIVIKAGEMIPLDGIVSQGSSFIKMVHLTGESEPLAARVGDEVASGSVNLEGTLTLKVTRISNDSTLHRIMQLMTQAQEAKPAIERFLDRFGKWYAISIMLIAAGSLLTLYFFFGLPFLGLEGALYRSLSFLIAASPCALILATPTAYLSAMSSCAKKGILLKGGTILDALHRCRVIAFDKTGTLTTGALQCTGLLPLSATSIPHATAIAAAAGLEQRAHHPIGEAIVAHARLQQIEPLHVDHFSSKPGYGLEGLVTVDGGALRCTIGHPDFIASKLEPASEKLTALLRESAHALRGQHTLLLIEQSLFAFTFKDEIRPESKSALAKLKGRFHLVMLTGDHSGHAHEVASQLALDEIFANLRPEQKLDKVAELSQKRGLIMVGDGINDAPALARAHVGISMGSIGSATAVDASDIIFLKDDLSTIDWLIDKSAHTSKILKQNLTLALGVILLATTPALLGELPLWLAVMLHEGGTLLVGLNSLRLLK